MKESVWYFAGHDHIVLRVAPNRVELGCQGVNTIEHNGQKIQIPDILNLFTWKVNLKKWKEFRKKGWLIRLGNL